MSYTNGLDKPTDYFNTVLYTGNGTTGHAITGVGFQPDWIWIKERSSTSAAFLYDIIRGVDIKITPSTTDGDATQTDSMSSFDSDGFTVGVNNAVNESGQTVVAWNWLASNTTASNTDGSITSSVSANTTSGFSIVSYTGTGSNATVGHGLGVAPAFIIFKSRSKVDNWTVYHQTISPTQRLELNNTGASATSSVTFNDTAPTTDVFSIGTNSALNGSGETNIAYCFAEKKGFSKFGSYTGNGSTDGTFVYTGFKPAFVMVKRTDSAERWVMTDNKRDTFNTVGHWVAANASDAESDNDRWDFLSNGFKQRATFGNQNASGGTYIYMSFAENPFVTSSGIPTCAR